MLFNMCDVVSTS